MKIEEIKMNLCYKDKRNPFYNDLYDEDDLIDEENCYCDNCFYNRDEMANYLLELLSKKKIDNI